MLTPLVLALLVVAPSAAAGFSVDSLDPPASLAGPGWRCTELDVADNSTAADLGAWATLALPEPHSPQQGDLASAERCRGPVVWLRTTLSIAPTLIGEPIGVSLGEVHGAYQVFADGTAVGGLGEIGPPVVEALRRGDAFLLPAAALADGSVELAVRVVRDADALTTTQDRRTIIDGPLLAGHMPSVAALARLEVQLRVRDQTSAAVATTLLFLFVALYHVLVWIARRDLVGYLWFGLFALIANTWMVIVALAGTEALPMSARSAAVVGNFVGALVNAAFPEFFWRYLDKRSPPRRWRIYQLVLVLVSLIGFVPHYGVALTVHPVVILAKVAMPPWALVEFVRAARRGSKEARVLLVGMALAALGAPAQVYVQSNNISLPLSPGQVALAVFFLTMAVALVLQFARTLDEVDARAKELFDTNKSIERFVPFSFLRMLGKSTVRDVQRGDAANVPSMSVMFCDLRGFTTMAEQLGPDETFRFINGYLAHMEPEIHKAGGFINQYLGDGIMALFPQGADSAVDAAVAMARAVERLNDERARKQQEPIRIGIGIHTGSLMLGTLGGGDQLDSGVVGDVVNTAARLEGITKMYGATVLLSGATMTAMRRPEQRNLRPLDFVRAKGKREPLPLVELLDADPRELMRDKVDARAEFEQALSMYRKGKFDDAAVRFGALAVRVPGDSAARAFAERCQSFVARPPDAWEGVLSLTTK